MRILVTGADRPLGACLCRGLAAAGHDVRPVGLADTCAHDLGTAQAYGRVDLRLPANVGLAVAGVDSIVHAQPHDPPAFAGGEGELLEAVSRGTYVLVQAAREASVGRLVLLSRIDLYDAYPADYLVQPNWRPRPQPEAASLAPWLAELVCREIARAGLSEAVALRMGDLDAPGGTTADEAVAAVDRALQGATHGHRYRWEERHVAEGPRASRASMSPSPPARPDTAPVTGGRVVIFGAGGPVGAATIAALKEHYTLRCTDATALETIVAEQRRQSPTAPLPELLAAPHERRVVDVTDYEQVRAACEGMDAAINLTVLRNRLELAFAVNTVGAYHVAKAAAACGLKRLIHTGPFHTSLGHHADYWHDHDVVDDVPLHPGDGLYALSKYLGNRVTQVFAEACGPEVLTFLFCGFRTRRIDPTQVGSGAGAFTVSWEDSGESFLYGLRAAAMPSPYEPFFIAADSPVGKYRVDKARRLLGWEATDTFEAHQRRPFT